MYNIHMRLIVCCDGTYNSPQQRDGGKRSSTNVFKTYQAIESLGDKEQKALYLRGVGRGWANSIALIWRAVNRITFGLLDPLFGGSAGWGLSSQVRAAYSFLVSEYHPEDEIFIFGFSRGAYAARSLVGLIEYAGLLRIESCHLIRKAAKAYHRLNRGERHREFLCSLKSRCHADVSVQFLGVWDTVGALGTPVWGGDFTLNPLPIEPRFHDVNAFAHVDEAYHALAIDEQRAAFLPQLFDAKCGAKRFEQAWFRGVHSNVGGGYEDCGLSDIALRWMAEKAKAAGLRLSETGLHQQRTDAAVMRDSLGAFWIAGVWPRWFPITSDKAEPDYRPHWGYLHHSVNTVNIKGEPFPQNVPWLLDLEAGQTSSAIAVDAAKFWNNTRVVLRRGGRYLIQTNGRWRVRGKDCGPEGLAKGRSGRTASGRLGELVLLVNGLPDQKPPSGKLWKALVYLLWSDPSYLLGCLSTWRDLATQDEGRLVEPERTGVLHCFANCPWMMQRLNSGRLIMRVTHLT